MPMKTKIKKQCYLLYRLIFSGYYLLKISLNRVLQLTKKFVESCIFPNIHLYVYMIYSTPTFIFGYR